MNGRTPAHSFPVEDAYEALRRGLVALFRSKGAKPEDAADLAQDTITRAHVHITRHGAQRDDLWPLARTIARNLYVERIRKRAPRLVSLADAETVPDHALLPDDAVVLSESRRQLREAIATLPHRHRRVIEMTIDGVSPSEIAAHLGITRNAADALLHRARRSLSTKLESIRTDLAVVFAPVAIRLRLAARRAATAIGHLDPSGGITGTATGIVTVAVAAALAASPLAGGRAGDLPASIVTTKDTSVAAMRDSAQLDRATAKRGEDATRSPSDDLGSVFVADVDGHRVHADPGARNPADPDDPNTLSIDTWHEREPADRGSVGPVLDRATADACANATIACAGGTS